jgi:hypothetical protein
MAYRGNDIIRRLLSGLLFLIVILLPAGLAEAITLPVFKTVSHEALAGRGDEQPGMTASPVRNHSGLYRDGCEDPDGCICCLSRGFVIGNLPPIQMEPRPLVAASLSYLMLSATPPDGPSRAPDLPPPRHFV